MSVFSSVSYPCLVSVVQSPIPTTDQHDIDFLADTEDLDAVDERPEEEIRADMERLDASTNAGVLAIVRWRSRDGVCTCL